MVLEDTNTLTRAQLAEAVYLEVGLTQRTSGALVDEIFNQISRALAKGETVKLSGFGNFSVRKKNPRVGRNPKTGEPATISSRTVPVFKASNILKQKVNR